LVEHGVATNLENMEKLESLKVVREKSGKIASQGSWAESLFATYSNTQTTTTTTTTV